MMTYLKFFIALIFVFIPGKIFAQDLQLSIHSTPVQGSLYLEQSFDVAILNAQTPVHYVWDFGDNHVSFDSNPVHSYASPGEYRVWLNVIDADGQTGSAIHQIMVRHDVFQKDQQLTYHYLSSMQVSCIYWDQFQENTAWVGAQGGLIRVDFENDFQQYYRSPLPSGTVQDISQMFDQTIWIATTGGLVQFNARTLEWHTLHSFNSGLTENNISALATSGDRKKLWIGTMGGGIFCWDALEKIWTEYSTNNSDMQTNNIWDLSVDNQDNLWAATHRGLLFINTSTNSLHIFQTENSGLPDNVIHIVRHAPHNHIWLGTWNQGVVRFDPENALWKQYNLNNSPLTNNFVQYLTSTPDGNIWIATRENGLFRLDPDTNSWDMYASICRSNSNQEFSNIISTDENEIIVNVNDALVKMNTNGHCQFHTRLIHRHLPDSSVSCLIQSVTGDIWTGFRYKGLMQMSPKTHEWQYWDPMNSSLTSYDIRCIHEMSGGKIAVGTTNGLFLYDSNARQWTVFHTQNSDLPHNSVMRIFYDANANLWIGTMNGMARFYPATFQWTRYETITDTITCLAQTTDGRIWAGTSSNGFLAYQDSEDTWVRFNQSNSELPENQIQSMIGGQNRKLWIGMKSKGLSCLDLDTKHFEHFHSENTSLENNTINALAESQSGVIWVGTNNNHLYRFHPLTHEWQDIALTENVSDISSIIDIAIESEDNLWIGTQENGILHVSWPQSLESPGSVIIVDNSISRFSKYDHHLLVQNIYKTFLEKNFRHDDIWLMTRSQEIDINGDYCADSVIDSLPDPNRMIETITQWAKNRYRQDTPLFVFLLGEWNHSKGNELSYILSETTYLNVSQIHDALSIYEQSTRGQVIVVLDGEGSYDSFSQLTSKDRIVILSDSNPLTHENVYTSFLPDFMHQLSAGESVYQSFIEARKTTSHWMYHQANPLLDDNGDGIFSNIDGSFARQVKLIPSDSLFLEEGIQDVQLLSDNISDSVFITILCNKPMAQIQAQLIPLSGGYTPVSIIPLERCRFVSFCGSIQGITPAGQYELIVMANDYQGHMFVSKPEIIQIGNQETGSIWGKVNVLIGTHEVYFKHSNMSAILQNTDWHGNINTDGIFTLSQIPSGTYQMRIEGPGFSTSLPETIQVSAGGINQLTPITIDIAKSWCSMDSVCGDQCDLKDVIYLLRVFVEGTDY
jgi:ligand-binding sensor domain-containing protein